MFNKLNLHWGYTLVGCLSALMLPIPFVLGLYGHKLRAMSKNTMSMEELAMAMGLAPQQIKAEENRNDGLLDPAESAPDPAVSGAHENGGAEPKTTAEFKDTERGPHTPNSAATDVDSHHSHAKSEA